MIKAIKHRVYNFLLDRGIVYNPKEFVKFRKNLIYISRGAFARHGEMDDAWLFALSREHKKILDIGCNIGQSSMLMLLETDNEIVCVDPNPNALARCADNLIHNGLISNARFLNAFVGQEKSEQIEFFSSLYDAAGSKFASFAKTSSSIGKSRMVDQISVDEICKKLNFWPDLIKVDVEGAESDVLNGISEMLNVIKPKVFVEVHSGAELSIVENTELLLQWCSNHDYAAYYCKYHVKLESVDDIKKRGRYHLLLLPNETEYPKYLSVITQSSPLSIFE